MGNVKPSSARRFAYCEVKYRNEVTAVHVRESTAAEIVDITITSTTRGEVCVCVCGDRRAFHPVRYQNEWVLMTDGLFLSTGSPFSMHSLRADALFVSKKQKRAF